MAGPKTGNLKVCLVIPTRLIRTAPDETTSEMDQFWDIARELHPEWMHVDLRNSIDPAHWPLTGPYWKDCRTGAAWADMVRFEELFWRGGVYIDSDVEVLKPFDSLIGLDAFAGYEDTEHVCIAVMGFTPNHPIMRRSIELAIQRRHSDTWSAGMGSFQDAIKGRNDIALFPPGMFFPWSWRDREPKDWRRNNPWSYAAHYWAASWVKA